MGYLVGLSILLSVSICCMIASSFGCGETYHKVINLDCDPSKAGQMKFTTGKIFVCDGKSGKPCSTKNPLWASGDTQVFHVKELRPA